MAFALVDLARVADSLLVSEVERLCKADRAHSAVLIVHLGEVLERRLFLGLGYSSMFEYCRAGLGMSEAEAYLRIQAAKVGRTFPLVLERLGEGGLHLTAIKLLAPHLTAENHVRLLERVRGLSKRKIEEMVAELAPKPDVPARMWKLPAAREARGAVSSAQACSARLFASTAALEPAAAAPAAGSPSAAAPDAAAAAPRLAAESPSAAAPDAAASTPRVAAQSLSAAAPDAATAALRLAAQPLSGAALDATTSAPGHAAESAMTAQPVPASPSPVFVPQPPAARATPLSPGRFKLEATLDQEEHDALEQLRELLRHQIPNGDIARVVGRALKALCKSEMKRRFAQSVPARGSHRAPDAHQLGGHPTAAVSDNSNTGPCANVDVEDGGSAADAPQVDGSTDTGSGTKTTSPNSRYIPRAVLREVYARDEGQCTYVSPEGRRCAAREFLEVHHHNVTFARGGAATVENLRLTCRAHNAFLAEQDYGRAFMREKLRQAQP
jgi:hypothetical protein